MTKPVQVLILALACLAIGFCLGGAARQDGLFGSSMAAWVQAIGAGGAIYAAWIIGNRQARESRGLLDRQLEVQADRDAAALRATREVGLTVMLVAQGRLRIATRILTDERPTGGQTLLAASASCEGSELSMAAFPAHLIADAVAMSWFLEAQGTIELMIRYMRHTGERYGEGTDASFIESVDTLMRSLKGGLEQIQIRIEGYADRFDFEVPEPVRQNV